MQVIKRKKLGWLDRVRQKPSHVKQWYAIGISTAITLGIFIIWSVTLANDSGLSGNFVSSQSTDPALVINGATAPGDSGDNASLTSVGGPWVSFENGWSSLTSALQTDIKQISVGISSFTTSSANSQYDTQKTQTTLENTGQ
jgi:hypothetical protein